MPNNVSPPNLILGVLEAPGGAAQFSDYEQRRRRETNKAPDAKEWYEENKGKHPFIIDTVHNSNLINFKMTFGKVANSQTACTVEFIDPESKFENLILDSLFRDRFSYASTLNNMVLESRKSWLGGPGMESGFSRVPDLWGQHRMERLPLELNPKPFESTLNYVKNLPKSPGFTKPLVLVFGAGNDLRTWSPATVFKIATIDYGLTPNNVRKFILNLVVSPGALLWDEVGVAGDGSNDQENLQDGAKANNIVCTLPFIHDVKKPTHARRAPLWRDIAGPGFRYNNPVELYLKLWENGYAALTKTRPLLLIEGVVSALNKKWSDALYTSVNNYLTTAFDNRAPHTPTGPGSETVEELAKTLATAIDSKGSGEEFTEFNALAGLDIGDNRKRLWDTNYFTLGTASMSEGWEKYVQKTFGEAGSYEAELDAILQAIDKGGRVEFWDDLGQIGDPSQDYGSLENLVWASQYLGDDRIKRAQAQVANNTLKNLIRGGRINKSYGDWTARKFAEVYLKQRVLGAGFTKAENFIVIKSLSTFGLYKVLLGAAKSFFKSPFHIEVGAPGAKSMVVRGINIYENLPTAQIGKTPQENIEDIGTPPVNIVLRIDNGPVKFRDTLKSSIVDLVGTNKRIISLPLSEVSLMNKFTSLFNEAVAKGAIAGPPINYTSIDFLTTYNLFYSLVNQKKILKKKGDPDLFTREHQIIYNLFFEAFSYYIGGENDPNVSRVAFGETFSHPDALSLLLPTTDGNLDFLTPVEAPGNTTDFTGIKSNQDFRTFLSQNNIPVFNYGFKNSNVIGFNMELKIWYAFMLSIIPQILNNGLISQAFGDAKANKSIMDIYKNSESPRLIKEKLGKYFDDNIGTWEELERVPGTGTWQTQQKAVPDPTQPEGYRHEDVDNTYYIYPESRKNNASYIAAVSMLGKEVLQVGGHDSRDIFIETMLVLMKLNLRFPEVSNRFYIDYNDQDNVIELITELRDKLSNRTFKGTLDTLPLYSRCSTINSLGHKCLLYFVEPEITNVKTGQSRSTWLSGLYTIVGFSIMINDSTVKNSFEVVREGTSSMGAAEK